MLIRLILSMKLKEMTCVYSVCLWGGILPILGGFLSSLICYVHWFLWIIAVTNLGYSKNRLTVMIKIAYIVT